MYQPSHNLGLQICRLVHQLQRAGAATVLIDVEGEYTEMDLPTVDPQMQTALQRRDLEPAGTRHLRILHVIGRETSREACGALHHTPGRPSDVADIR